MHWHSRTCLKVQGPQHLVWIDQQQCQMLCHEMYWGLLLKQHWYLHQCPSWRSWRPSPSRLWNASQLRLLQQQPPASSPAIMLLIWQPLQQALRLWLLLVGAPPAPVSLAPSLQLNVPLPPCAPVQAYPALACLPAPCARFLPASFPLLYALPLLPLPTHVLRSHS